mgnify:CR=1 FL=1
MSTNPLTVVNFPARLRKNMFYNIFLSYWYDNFPSEIWGCYVSAITL